LTLLVLLTSLNAYSQELPNWKNIDGNACYDLAGAKALKKFEVDCTTCSDKLEVRVARIAELQLTVGALEISRNLLDTVTERDKSTIDRQLKLIDRQEVLLMESEAWSLKGAALPWALATVVTVALAAFAVGVAF